MNTRALRILLEAMNNYLDEAPVMLWFDNEWHTITAVQADEDRVILQTRPFVSSDDRG